jgi:glycosyltransferase involved in cell wall biosynthesis
LRVISHTPNRGYGAALKEGFAQSKYKYVVFTDGDGQFDFTELHLFVEAIEGADMVIGYRKKRSDHNLGKRLLLMYILKVADFILFRFTFRDVDCAFKMLTRHTIDEITPLRSEGAIITTEILAKAKRKKLKIKEVGIHHYPRAHGQPTGANLPVLIRAGLEILTLWYDLHYGRT